MAALHHQVHDVSVGALTVTPLTHGEEHRLEEIALSQAHSVDLKGRYRPSHSHGVARAAQLIAHTLGFRGDAVFRIRIAGLMHDVGKLQIPDSILLKPDTLTPSEWSVIEHHPIEGHRTLQALGLEDEARWVLHHHERGDGRGYPTGLTGDAIPLGSRILSVADAFDVMCSQRVYQPARSPEDALTELRANESGQFDGDVVDALDTALATGALLVSRNRLHAV